RYSSSNAAKSDLSQCHNTIVNTDADDKIERIYHEFDKIAFFLGFYGGENGDGNNNEDHDKIGESSGAIEPASPHSTTVMH
ncbi:4596_t:CDS:2, partial [Diversispora eburnea]